MSSSVRAGAELKFTPSNLRSFLHYCHAAIFFRFIITTKKTMPLMNPPSANVSGVLTQWATDPANMLPKGVSPPKVKGYILITRPRSRSST